MMRDGYVGRVDGGLGDGGVRCKMDSPRGFCWVFYSYLIYGK